MNEVFRYLGYSKQAFHQKMDRRFREQEYKTLLLDIIVQLRQEHPGVAARVLYDILQPEHMGRDKFERFCFDHGLKLPKPKAYHRTTDSTGVVRFPNLAMGRELTHINQVWSSDITYYEIEKTYYLTFILDLFSRKIVGYSVSKRLLTEQTTIPALKMALRLRKPAPGLIFHSDGGGQYYNKAFLKLTQERKIKNSMCDVAYENPYAERVNGTIKNQYLKGYAPSGYASLVVMTKRAVNNYNKVRPHKSLSMRTPEVYEALLPAGGCSPAMDVFLNCGKNTQHQMKKHPLPANEKSLMKTSLKKVEKTVNVI